MENKINKTLKDLNTLGYYKTNVSEVLDEEGLNMFNDNIEFFNNMLESSKIQSILNTIHTNPQQRMDKTGGKPFEITHHDYLDRALGINDGSFIKLHLHNYFTTIASKFLEVDNPYVFNIIPWIHTWKNDWPRLHSQNWHRDREDYKLLKIFMYYSEVEQENGPFEYVPKSFSGGDFYGLYKGRSKYSDYASDSENRGHPRFQEEIDKCEETYVSFTGKPGDIIMVNNSGFHRGGFVQEGIRVMTCSTYIRPDAEYVKPDGKWKYFTGFNQKTYDPKINYIDFSSKEFKQLGNKAKHLMPNEEN